jgi:hypothetical protein
LAELAVGRAEAGCLMRARSSPIVRHVWPARSSATRMMTSARKQTRTCARMRSSRRW